MVLMTLSSAFMRAGVTIREIQHHLAATLGTELSHESISNITEAVMGEVTHWQDRPVEVFDPVIFLGALVVKVRDQSRDGEPPRPHCGRSRYRGCQTRARDPGPGR